jgi:ubiquinone/menaquinone biosynthesis C-methylase UbiE
MSALDVGCGPGFFTLAMAGLVGERGQVIAADLQEGMLTRLSQKIRGTPLETRIRTVKCDRDNINVSGRVDFVLTFYMVHEVPDKASFFRQLFGVLSAQGRILIVEPKLFHVSRSEFERTLAIAEGIGFERSPAPPLLLSWTSLLAKRPAV